MNRLPKPKDNIEEQKQRNNSQPKIFFGLEELGYYTGKVKDNGKHPTIPSTTILKNTR